MKLFAAALCRFFGFSDRATAVSVKARVRSKQVLRFAAIALAGCFALALNPASAQVTAPPDINGTFPTGQDNLAGTATNTSTPAIQQCK